MQSFSSSIAQALHLIAVLDPVMLSVVWRSLVVSSSASVIAALLGFPLGAWLGVARFRGRSAVIAVLHTLLALPSVVVGLAVYLLLSRSGPLGGLGWLFSLKAMVFAQSILVLPVFVGLTRQWIDSAEAEHGEQLRAMGASATVRALLLLADARWAMLTVLLAGFGRALSEVGAVMVVGGNIEGFTRVMTTAIALETSKGDVPMALALGLILLFVVLALQLLALAVTKLGVVERKLFSARAL